MKRISINQQPRATTKGLVAQFYEDDIEKIILWKYCSSAMLPPILQDGFMDKNKQKAIKYAKELLKIKREIREIKKQLKDQEKELNQIKSKNQ